MIAEAILDDINRTAETQWVSPYVVATVYFALDEMDRGFYVVGESAQRV